MSLALFNDWLEWCRRPRTETDQKRATLSMARHHLNKSDCHPSAREFWTKQRDEALAYLASTPPEDTT